MKILIQNKRHFASFPCDTKQNKNPTSITGIIKLIEKLQWHFPEVALLSTAFSDRIEFRSVEFCGGRKTENPEKDTYIAIKDDNGI